LGPEADKRDAVLIMAMTHFHFAAIVNGVDNWRGVRTRQHTYARYEDGSAWLLYDNKEDPFQMNNLAEDPDYVDLIQELNQKLDVLLKEAGDAEDTKALYDLIIKENPERTILNDFREVNPDNPVFN
jgi:arylsulfatase A-like enzyme